MKSLVPVLFLLKTTLFFGQTLQITDAKFKTGDNVTWSQPLFDDSKWATLQTNIVWDEQGYKDYNGFAWYRMHVKISSFLKEQAYWKDSLRINLAKIDDADEVYLNGVLIGKKGSFPTSPMVMFLHGMKKGNIISAPGTPLSNGMQTMLLR
jgi:hypothetical protein